MPEKQTAHESNGGKRKIPQADMASKPSDSWETAYLYAFIWKFTDICHKLDTCFLLQSVSDLEIALEAPEPRPILASVLQTFHSNLKLVTSKASWEHWVVHYIDDIIAQEIASNGRFSILHWDENLMRNTSDGFWGLNWKDRLRVLRVLVDHQLTFSVPIRAIIDDHYGLTSKRSTEDNQLRIEPLGLDRDTKTWWQIDDSARLYSSGNPHKPTCSWQVLCSDVEGLEVVKSKLAQPPATIKDGLAPIFRTKSNRNKPDGRLQREWNLRHQIEARVPRNLVAREARFANLRLEKEKIELAVVRKAQREAAAARDAAVAAQTVSSRSTRLRTQVKRPDYLMDDMTDRAFEKHIENSLSEAPVDLDSLGRKRRRTNGEAHTDEEWEDNAEIGNEEPPVQTTKRAPKAKASKQEWKGERRSSRIQSKIIDHDDEDEVSEPEIVKPASTWSRSQAAVSPTISPVDPVDLGGNISVWSKGKLVFVQGHNRYSAKPAVAPPKKKTIAKAGGGTVVHEQQCTTATATSDTISPPTTTATNTSSSSYLLSNQGGAVDTTASLSNLKARLAAMDGDGESSSDDGFQPPPNVTETGSHPTLVNNDQQNSQHEKY